MTFRTFDERGFIYNINKNKKITIDVLNRNIFVNGFFVISSKEQMILKTILFLNHFSHVFAIVGGYETEPHRNVLLNMMEYEFKLVIPVF